jgi:hypothetical protein
MRRFVLKIILIKKIVMLSNMLGLRDRSKMIFEFNHLSLRIEKSALTEGIGRQDSLYWKYYDFEKLLCFPI